MDIDKIESILQPLMDDEALYLFDKKFNELTPYEQSKVHLYVYDKNHPVWKDILIDDKKTGYKINQLGDVKDSNDKLIKQFCEKEDWYYTIYLAGTNCNVLLVHRLVAKAFIPNPENKPQVNHKNGKKGCNWVGNLEWNTAKENAEHAWKNGLTNNSGENQGSAIYSNYQIKKVCKLLENGLSNSEVSKLTGVKLKIVSNIRTGRGWKSISKNYNIPKNDETKYTPEQVHSVCRLLENPDVSHSEISSITGVDLNAIKDIMKKTSYKSISDGYNICKRSNIATNKGRSKYTAEQIKSVCELLQYQNANMKYISLITNVGLSTVYDIRDRRKWNTISKNYLFNSKSHINK